MSTLVAVKPSNLEQQRAQAMQQNLIDSGDLEPAEFKDTYAEADEPKFRQWGSKEKFDSFSIQNSLDMARGIYFSHQNEGANLREGVFDNTADAVEAFLRKDRTSPENRTEIGGRIGIDFNSGQVVADAEKILYTRVEVPSVFSQAFEPRETTQNSFIQKAEGDNVFKQFISEINFGLLFGTMFKAGKEFFGAMRKLGKEEVVFKEQPNQADMTSEQIKAKDDEAKKKRIISDNAQRIAAQAQAMPSAEVARAQEQEDRRINQVIGRQESATVERGIGGRLKAYVQTLFERGQLDAEAAKKKQEKEASLRQATKKEGFTGEMKDYAEKSAGGHFLSNAG